MRITTIRLNATLLSTALAAALGAGLPATSAQAAAIVGASSVSANVGSLTETSLPLNSTIDQRGLSAAYVSGSTDFDGYVASTTHTGFRFVTNNVWHSALGTTAGRVTFGFGAPVVIDALALWGLHGRNPNNIKDFQLFGDTDQLLGSYTAALNFTVSLEATPAQVFGFAALSTSSITLDFSSHFGGLVPGFGEVAFRAGTLPVATLNTGNPDPAAAVPEPGSFALAGLALAGLALTRRRRA